MAILYCFVNKEVSLLSCATLLTYTNLSSVITFLISAFVLCSPKVQSEVLKKWKRWKLGRNIEEEYRHTYSNTPNTKTASLLNHVSRLPHLPDITKSSAPACSPEEKHMLVAGCHNGSVHSKGSGKCTTQQHEAATSNCTLVEDISLSDRMHNYEAEKENVESHL